jgi:DNA polymerase sigma
MAAQDEARLRGLPPLVMDPVLLNQLKRMQDFYKPQQPQLQQQQQQQTNGEEQQQQGADGAASSSASSSSSSSGPSSTASGGHQYASRAALIAAASEVHFRPVGRSGRHGQGHHGHSRVTVHPGMEQDLRRLLATLEPDPRTFEIRRELQAETQRIVQGAWGAQRCQVRLFGSSVNTLCETNSDVDMCLDILPDPEAETEEARAIDKPAIVEKLAALLSPIMHDILPLPKARVPIVKFTAPAKFGGLRCDIGINNLLACRNSELIRDYMAIDARARDMCLIIKHFAKRRQINDTYRGTLSSYCYVLMVIHYLQSACHVNPPILPCLQSIERNKDTDKPVLIDGFDCWYNTDVERFKGFGQANTQTLGELLVSTEYNSNARERRHCSNSRVADPGLFPLLVCSDRLLPPLFARV